jgi:uncharacterized paraquat-inducible protein A
MSGAKGMKAYIAISGTLFGLLVLAHLWRLLEEGSHVMREPVFVVATIAPAALCIWALRLLLRSRVSGQAGLP